MNNNELLVIEHLSISFRGLVAVNNFKLDVKEGEIYGLIGPNGAGKTTVFNMISGIYKPTKGRIYLDGKDVTGLPPAIMNRKGIARTFQNIRLFNNMSVVDNITVAMNMLPEYQCNIFESIFRFPKFFKKEHQMRKDAKALLEIFKMKHLRNELASNLPYGQQRRLEIARALASQPKLLLLDEPAAGMNPEETRELMETIKFIRDTFHVTILIIEHNMKLISNICDRMTVLNFGSILASGTAEEVLTNPEVVKAYLGE